MDYPGKESHLYNPGDLMSIVIHKITGETPCPTCDARIQQMNTWGWIKTWHNRRLIVGWIRDESIKRGYPSTDNAILIVFKETLKSICRNSQSRKLRP